MTDFQRFRERTRDIQDYNERGVWGALEYVNGAGAVVRIRGTDTIDEEAPLLNTGYGFNVPQDYNTEVVMLSLGSDTNQKYAVASIPRDKQRQWAENTGGVQNPIDPEKALEFGPDGVWVKEGTVFFGDDKGVKVTVSGGNVTLESAGTINFVCAGLQHNGVNVGDTHVHGGIEPGGADTDEPH